jgi:hypothetical protein
MRLCRENAVEPWLGLRKFLRFLAKEKIRIPNPMSSLVYHPPYRRGAHPIPHAYLGGQATETRESLSHRASQLEYHSTVDVIVITHHAPKRDLASPSQ